MDKIKNKSGVTLVELMVTIVVSSLLTFSIARAYSVFASGNSSLRRWIEFQEHLIRSSRFIEKDIRMAGLNLPGNGIRPVIADENNHKLYIFTNNDNKKTVLSSTASPGDSILFVNDDRGVLANQCVCLCGNDTVYYQIARVGHNETGIDTIAIADSVLSEEWHSSDTELFFAQGIHYAVEEINGGSSLVRRTYNRAFEISTEIEKIEVVPKDQDGSELSNNFSLTRSITITFKKNLQTLIGEQLVSSNCEANIRNFN